MMSQVSGSALLGAVRNRPSLVNRLPVSGSLKNSTVVVLFAALGCSGELAGGRPGGRPAVSTDLTGLGGNSGLPDLNATGGSAVGGPGSSLGGAATVTTETRSFACGVEAQPKPAVLRRLTVAQYRNTLSDLLTGLVAQAEVDVIVGAVGPALATLPRDRREPVPEDIHGSYRRLDQTLQQVHVDGFYSVGVALGNELTTSAHLASVVGACATDADASNDAACLDSFIRQFGAKALRRALTAEDVMFYKSVYGASTTADSAAYADMIGVLLNAPEFLYFVEHGAAAVPNHPAVYELSAYEIASRLSYQLWQTLPDTELAASAADGTLLTPTVFQAQVARMIASPRAQTALHEFWEDWMRVTDVPLLNAKVADPVFKAFAGGDLPGATLNQSMIDDVVGLIDYYTWQKPATVGALVTSELSFARAPELAKIYGVPVWDGVAAPPAFPLGQRPGLLTRALFLSTGSANTRPIMKGVFIRKNVLCDSIPPPPPGANAKPPELEPGLTTRETVEQITEQPGTVCGACHASIINPLGFATEGFDSLGRFRTEQKLYEATGMPSGSKPVKTDGVPQVVLGDQQAISTPSELMALVQSSSKVEACLARSFFRYTYARWEDTTTDGCALEDARKALVSGKISDLLSAAALTPDFRRRNFE